MNRSSPATRQTVRIAIALVLLLIFGQAIAEPFSGSPRDDPAVRMVSWLVLIVFSVGIGFLLALFRCRSDLRVFRVAVHTLAFGSIVGLIGYLSPAFKVLIELVSLVLHLLF